MQNKYILNKGFIIQKAGKSITIFDPENSLLYTLNATASYIFTKIKSGKEIEEIVSSLARDYDASKEQLEKDLVELLDDLVRKKILIRK